MPVRMVLRQTFEAKSIFLYLKAMRLEYARHKQGLLFICNKVHAPKQLAQRALARGSTPISIEQRSDGLRGALQALASTATARGGVRPTSNAALGARLPVTCV